MENGRTNYHPKEKRPARFTDVELTGVRKTSVQLHMIRDLLFRVKRGKTFRTSHSRERCDILSAEFTTHQDNEPSNTCIRNMWYRNLKLNIWR
jgi:hypothetical protein